MYISIGYKEEEKSSLLVLTSQLVRSEPEPVRLFALCTQKKEPATTRKLRKNTKAKPRRVNISLYNFGFGKGGS